MQIVRGWRVLPATPSTHSTPAGATDAGRQSWYSAGTGLAARPQGTPASGGDGCRRIAPFVQALPIGKATNFVFSPDFTRNKTARLPSLRASARLLRTSAGVDTALPPTSRMMSPTWKP
jgi:hypothetical protein